MKKILFGMICVMSTSAFAESICSQGLKPKYVCTTNDADDGLYRLISGDITVCQWGNRAEVVTIEINGERQSLPATVVSNENKAVYSIVSEDEVVAKLMINKTNGVSSFTITGDSLKQKRHCKTVK